MLFVYYWFYLFRFISFWFVGYLCLFIYLRLVDYRLLVWYVIVLLLFLAVGYLMLQLLVVVFVFVWVCCCLLFIYYCWVCFGHDCLVGGLVFWWILFGDVVVLVFCLLYLVHGVAFGCFDCRLTVFVICW